MTKTKVESKFVMHLLPNFIHNKINVNKRGYQPIIQNKVSCFPLHGDYAATSVPGATVLDRFHCIWQSL